MEENELEEGEACSGQEEDAFIDPDTLSYIDEKLQDVLGHFQKDFEGGVSAENLGAKFGGYGSFLPSYQRSPPIWSQPKSPPRPPTHNSTRSPYNLSLETVRQDHSVPTSGSISKNNTVPTAQCSDSSGKKENSVNNTGGCIPQHNSISKPVNGNDQKTLKVRIKVCPDSSLARNNAAIYSGLGLDYSPSSSPEDSPHSSGGLSSEFPDAPDASPTTILQIMTCFTLPGGYLLSPLPESHLRWTENGSSSLRSCKVGMPRKNHPEKCVVIADVTLPIRDTRSFVEKKTKADEKNRKAMEEEYLNHKDDSGTILKKDTDSGISTDQKLVSHGLNVTRQSTTMSVDAKGERQTIGNSGKGISRILDSLEPNQASVKDRISLSDLVKDGQLESVDSMKSSGFSNLENETAQLKGGLSSKTSMREKTPDARSTGNQKVVSSDMRREGKGKSQKNSDIIKLDPDGYKCRNDYVGGDVEHVKQISAQKSTSQEKDGDKMLHGNQISEGKRKQKGSHSNGTAAAESTKEQLMAISSAGSKDKKKSSHGRGGHSENKSKSLKSHKETNRGRSRESHKDVASNITAEKVDSRSDILEPTLNEKPKEMQGVKNMDNIRISKPLSNTPTVTPATGDAPTSDAAAVLPAPVLIQDNWVCCDICQKWRLLPYGMDTAYLPKQWQCSMQVWLPGLNRCSISEEETTKAFNELFLAPAPLPVPDGGTNLNGHHTVVASTIPSATSLQCEQRVDSNLQSVPSTGKKKNGLMDAANVTNPSLVKFPNSAKKSLPGSIKSRSLNDVTEHPSETNSFTKAGPGQTSKGINSTAEKHKHKHKEKDKIAGRYSDADDFIEKSGKHLKSKNKREMDQDGFKTSKKVKKEASQYIVEDWQSGLDMAGKPTLVMDKVKDMPPVSIKRSRDPVCIFSNEESKEYSDVERINTLEFPAKKRKAKEWKENEGHQEAVLSSQHAFDNRSIAKEAFSESELRRQKKTKVSKESSRSIDGKADKKGRSARVLLSGNKEQQSDGMNEEIKAGAGKDQIAHHLGIGASQQSLDGIDSSKRDMTYTQPPTAAASSSSKVSSSRKSKANIQEARGSPVESVSSSPLRFSNTETHSTKRNSVGKDDVIHVGLSAIGSPKRCSDAEVDGSSDQSGTRKKEKVSIQSRSIERAAESRNLDSSRGTASYQDKELTRISGGNSKDGLNMKKGTCEDLSPTGFEETNVVDTTETVLDHHNTYQHERLEKGNRDQDKLNNRYSANGSSQQKSDKSSSLYLKERNRNSNIEADKGKLKVSESSGEQELRSVKKGGSVRPGADFDCHEDSTYPDDLRVNNYCNQEKDLLEKKVSNAKWHNLGRRNNHADCELQENLDTRGPSTLSKQHKDYDLRATFEGASYPKSNLQANFQQTSHHSENPISHFPRDRIDQSEMSSGRGKSQSVQPAKDKHEAQNWGSQTGTTPIKGNKSEVYPIIAENGDVSKLVKSSSKSDGQNGVHPNCLRQATPNGPDTSPIRKDGPASVNTVLKEARDLKHTANRLKSEGQELVSTGLYFEAALKFLHVASLLEPASIESAKPGELNPTIQMYSDTAKLCEFCAHEYEKCKEMASAALAYKCVEVAYMKVAYYKHPSANKDRRELQSALHMVLPGESPSSSASDVDNLNNQSTLDKTASAKPVGSPQVAGSHVVAPCHRPQFMRLLSYTNDLNCAFEATKRSQNAIAAACVSQDKDRVDGMSSVRKVLDFNFHNVEGLLRLVRLTLESIGG